MMNRKGFTLVELMIVVAIIGILAAIAIPNFVDMQYRAKRAEVPSNVDGIKTAELAYEASFDAFVSASDTPGSVSKAQQAFAGGGAASYATLGWGPDGDVRGSYSVSTSPTDFTVTGRCDVDGDLTEASYQSTKTTNSVLLTGNNVY